MNPANLIAKYIKSREYEFKDETNDKEDNIICMLNPGEQYCSVHGNEICGVCEEKHLDEMYCSIHKMYNDKCEECCDYDDILDFCNSQCEMHYGNFVMEFSDSEISNCMMCTLKDITYIINYMMPKGVLKFSNLTNVKNVYYFVFSPKKIFDQIKESGIVIDECDEYNECDEVTQSDTEKI